MPALKTAKIPRNQPNYRWCRMFQAQINEFAADPDMSGNAFRTFLGLLAVLDFANEADITQKALSKHLGISVSGVSKSLTLLERKNIISKVEKSNGRVVFRINDRYVLKGDIQPLRAVR